MEMRMPFVVEEVNPAISFKNICISRSHPSESILSSVSGYVIKGGITAVMGPTGSGKSLLLQCLSGRVQNLSVTGDFFMEGVRIDHSDISNDVAFVARDNILIGELTSRETLYNSAALKRNKPLPEIVEDVERFLEILGVGEVADKAIGTPFFRGLSNGQKKLIDIGSELVAAPLVLFLDEPTDDMDLGIAYEVLKTIKDVAKEHKMSIMISITHSSARILELFDHIMLLGGGAMTFFGTVPESIEYFTSIGFPPLDDHIPTDYFLQISDPTNTSVGDFNFEGSFTSSSWGHQLTVYLDGVERRGSVEDAYRGGRYFPVGKFAPNSPDSGLETESERFIDTTHHSTPFWRQYCILVKRYYALATRDPTMYLLQFILSIVLAFFIGAVFFKLPRRIDISMNNIPAGILWIVFLMSFIQIFKIHHLSRDVALFKHERANNAYDVLPAFLAETTSACVGCGIMVPGSAIAYFMMGLPLEAFPFLILIFWTTTLASESLINVLSRMNEDCSLTVVASQAVLVMLTVFGGGVFIPWSSTPFFWRWLQEISLFTHATRAALLHVGTYVTYKCVTVNGVCFGPYMDVFPCDVVSDDGLSCTLSGRTVLYITQGSSRTDTFWTPYMYLVVILVACRIALLLSMMFPPDKVIATVKEIFASETNDVLVKGMASLRRIEAQLKSLCAEKHSLVHPVPRRVPPIGPPPGRGVPFEQLFNEAFDSHMDDEAVGTDPNRAPFCIVWKNLTYAVKGRTRPLFEGVTGFGRSGRVLSLMGPVGSGAGTLLEALGHRVAYGSVSGEVRIGKRDLLPNDVSYVTEVDEVNPNLTVFEQIEFVGLMKCYNHKAMHLRLDNILKLLGIAKKSGVKCSKLSRVQVKKVGIAMGMINNPSVLLLDNPTTTLDSVAAMSILQCLSDIAHVMNAAVLMTIHTPSGMVFELLQDLYVLSAGKLAYSGPASCVEQYFRDLGHNCPPRTCQSDFFIVLLTRSPMYQNAPWHLIYNNSNFGKNTRLRIIVFDEASSSSHSPLNPPEWPTKMRYAVLYFLRYYMKDRAFYPRRLLLLVAIALFNGTLFMGLTRETLKLPMFMGAITQSIWGVLLSTVGATCLYIRDRKLAVEMAKSATAYPAIYCSAQFIASVPFNLLCAAVFQGVFYLITNIDDFSSTYIYTTLLQCGNLMLMEALLLCTVQIMKNAELSSLFSTVLLVFLYLFSGFFVPVGRTSVWIQWVSFLSPTRYAYEGYLHSILDNTQFYIDSTGGYLPGERVASMLDPRQDTSPYFNLLVLACTVLLVRAVHYLLFLRQVWPYLPSTRRRPDRRTSPTEDVVGDDDDSIPSTDTAPNITRL